MNAPFDRYGVMRQRDEYRRISRLQQLTQDDAKELMLVVDFERRQHRARSCGVRLIAPLWER